MIFHSNFDELVELIKLVTQLSKDRVNNYNKWIRVGWVLHNTNYDLLPVWIEFSKNSKKYKKGECEKLWSKMKNTGYNINSLKNWIKEDNYIDVSTCNFIDL